MKKISNLCKHEKLAIFFIMLCLLDIIFNIIQLYA